MGKNMADKRETKSKKEKWYNKKHLKYIFPVLIFLLMSVITAAVLNGILYNQGDSVEQVVGKNAFVILFMILLFVYIHYFKKDVFFEKRYMFMLAIIYFIAVIPSMFLVNTEFIWLIPFTLVGMIVSLLIEEHLGIMVNVIVTLIIAIMGSMQLDFLLFFIISGSIAPILTSMAKERQKMFYVALYMMAVNGALFLLRALFISENYFEIVTVEMLFVLLNPALAVIMTYGSLPLWETIFNIMTPFKLLELTTSNQKLLQRLMLEAPGTYHHSMMVANLAETAAVDIGANALLARSGALFHDVGKLKNPHYFTENQNGENPHDVLAPDSSAKIIINHVSDGVKLAKEYKLPKVIIDIIEQHQGDSVVFYFYHKAKEHSDGFKIDPKDFSYPGPKPQNKEAVLVMLADCVEAAIKARSEKERNMETIQQVIKDILKSKMLDGQLTESDIKLKELIMIEQAFIKVYNGLYHERVKYPEAK